MEPEHDLHQLIAAGSQAPSSPPLELLRDVLIERYRDSVQAILFYGSCLRSGDLLDGLVDLYVIVDRYRRAYRSPWLAIANRLLPPNVFYLEVPWQGATLRAKYNVLSLRDLGRTTSRRWFHSYFWGRLAQPVGIAYARDESIRALLIQSLAQAVKTFATRVVPMLPQEFDAALLWSSGVALCYRTELRAERAARGRQIFESYDAYYRSLTQAIVPLLPFRVEVMAETVEPRFRATVLRSTRIAARVGWTLRRLQGKILSLLRLVKALFTFRGGLDYIAWKLERHTGVQVEITPRLRRHPLLFSWGLMWRLYRRGVFR